MLFGCVWVFIVCSSLIACRDCRMWLIQLGVAARASSEMPSGVAGAGRKNRFFPGAVDHSVRAASCLYTLCGTARAVATPARPG